jgi:glyoxylase-like metal-dependent hydrolase (beta-lactamase superfamily II)
MSSQKPEVLSFFDPSTWTVTHLAADPAARVAVVIDPVLDFDSKSGRTGTTLAEGVLAAARARDWSIVYILETHAHADHITAAPFLKARTGAAIGIGDPSRRQAIMAGLQESSHAA